VVKGGGRVRLTVLQPSVSQLYRRFGSLDLSHPYGPLWPITGKALLFFFTSIILEENSFARRKSVFSLSVTNLW
jgi:hypothetical protein